MCQATGQKPKVQHCLQNKMTDEEKNQGAAMNYPCTENNPE